MKKSEVDNKFMTSLKKLFLIFLVVIVAIIFAMPGVVSSVENSVVNATSAKPETFTELYFDQHTSLPTQIGVNIPYHFSFTIHNLENRDVNYTYQTIVNAGNIHDMTDSGSVFIKNGELKTIHETFTFTQNINRAEVVVNLVNKHQQIDFWLGENK